MPYSLVKQGIFPLILYFPTITNHGRHSEIRSDVNMAFGNLDSKSALRHRWWEGGRFFKFFKFSSYVRQFTAQMGDFTAQSESRTHDRPKTSPRKTTEPSHCISSKNVVENIYSGDRFFARRTIGRESDGGRASPEQLENNLKTESFVFKLAMLRKPERFSFS